MSINKIPFCLLPPPLVTYILEISDDPVVRQVCKVWKLRFGDIYYNRWMKIENNVNEMKDFRERLTEVRENFGENRDGFVLVYSYFNRLINDWNYKRNYSLKLKNLPYLLSTAVKIENEVMLLKFVKQWPKLEEFSRPKAIERLKSQTGGYFNENELVEEKKLESLPSEIEFLQVRYLHLKHNHLSDLPKSIHKIEKLYMLSLSYNRFVKFPSTLCSLPKLQVLNLSDNQLENLPREIFKMECLTTLYLARNKLTTLPEEIDKLINLKFFDISENKLTSLPLGICYLEKLFTLSVKENNPLPQKRIIRIPTAYVRDHHGDISPFSNRGQAQKAKQADLENELHPFFNFELLKAERGTKAMNPLSQLYKAIICNNKKGLELAPFVNKLSKGDRELFYHMIIKCEKSFNRYSQLLINNPSGQEICFKVSQQVFDQAVIGTIFRKNEKKQSEDIEMDYFRPHDIILDVEQLEEFERVNLMDLANKKG